MDKKRKLGSLAGQISSAPTHVHNRSDLDFLQVFPIIKLLSNSFDVVATVPFFIAKTIGLACYCRA